jgi:ADP-ribosylglycohydrolase
MLSKYRGVILGLAYADALGAGYEFFKGRSHRFKSCSAHKGFSVIALEK